MHKRICHIVFIVLFSLLSITSLYSQTNLNTQRNYQINVKQFNEFVDRFNYKTDFLGNPIDSVFKSKISRKEYIDILFNAGDSRINSKNKDYLELKNEFTNQVINKNLLIDKYSFKIIAEAKSNITYKNKSKEISVFLNQQIENNGVKWVILNVKADFLDVLKEDTVLLRFIPPTSNETNFISLSRVFDDKGFQQYYMYSNYKYDQISAFLFALNTGLVKFNYVNEIIYHIYDVDGWHIQIKEFNRNSENSGWLIHDLAKTNSEFEDCLEDLLDY